MVRVRQCCCGCSLQTGTLILLWFGLICDICPIVQGLTAVFSSSGEEQSPLVNYQLPWTIVVMVVIICALVGVETRRPSFMLPCIIANVVGLISLAIGVFMILVGSITMRDANMRSHPHSKTLSEVYYASVSLMIFFWVIFLTLGTYFTIVIYSYYKQLLEELSGVQADRMIYAAPPDLQNKEMAYGDYPPAYEAPAHPYPQHNLVYPPQYSVYPQQNPVYPQPNQLYPQLHGQQ